jgi:hypothetical protein
MATQPVTRATPALTLSTPNPILAVDSVRALQSPSVDTLPTAGDSLSGGVSPVSRVGGYGRTVLSRVVRSSTTRAASHGVLSWAVSEWSVEKVRYVCVGVFGCEGVWDPGSCGPRLWVDPGWVATPRAKVARAKPPRVVTPWCVAHRRTRPWPPVAAAHSATLDTQPRWHRVQQCARSPPPQLASGPVPSRPTLRAWPGALARPACC